MTESNYVLSAAKTGGAAAVKSALALSEDVRIELAEREPVTGRTALHLLAAHADQTDAIEAVLEAAGDAAAELVALPDADGANPLHLGVHCPMTCYQLAAAAPGACLMASKEGATPVDVAVRYGSCEALNALLLACSGARGTSSLDAIRRLVKAGAVPDTWAPNGQSSLMLAAAANAGDAVAALLAAGASPELQDAMGRTALMWAAGSGAVAALQALLDGGASVSARDRRGRAALDYAEAPAARAVLEERVKALEIKAAAAEEALLAELEEEQERRASKKAKRRAKAKEKKKTASEPAKEQQQQSVPSSKKEDQPEEEGGEEAEGGNVAPELPPASDAKAAGGSTTDEDGHVLPMRPPSAQWRTVARKEKESKTAPTGARPPVPGQHRRSPSVGSVTSACSVASHDTADGAKAGSGGGDRAASGLRRGAAPTVPRLPAPQQRKALISRSTSGGEEPALLFSAVARENAWKVPLHSIAPSAAAPMPMPALAPAAVPAPAPAPAPTVAPAALKANTWASIAAHGPSRPSSRASGTPPPTARAPTPPPAAASVAPVPGPAAASVAPVPGPAAASVAPVPGPAAAPMPPAPAPTAAPVAPAPAPEQQPPQHQPVPEPQPSAESPALAAAQEEIAALRAEVQRLRLRAAADELAHQRELAAVMRDAAAAVAKAAADERAACTVRFAALLQGNGAALAAAVPSLLAGAGIATAGDLDVFLSSFANNTNPINAKLNSLEGINAAGTGASGTMATEALAAMGFPQPDARGGQLPQRAASSAPKAMGPLQNPEPTGASGDGSSGSGDSLFSPLSTSPFSFEVGEHLRGEFLGNHSAFMVPAAEPATASPPRAGGAWPWASPGQT